MGRLRAATRRRAAAVVALAAVTTGGALAWYAQATGAPSQVVQRGTDGDDRIVGTSAREHLWGGAGDDYIVAGRGDVVDCGPGVDVVDRPGGEPARNTRNCEWWRVYGLVGTPGSDELLGTSGPDVMYGHGGADVIAAGAGADHVVAGDGDRVDCGPGVDVLVRPRGARVVSTGCEHIRDS